MKFVVVLGLLVLVAVVACDGESTPLPSGLERKDAATMAQIAAWFKHYELSKSPGGEEVFDRAMLKELRDIELAGLSRHSHKYGLLLDAYVLRVEAEERIQVLEPLEQERVISQGTEWLGGCIHPADVYGEGRFSVYYTSEEFEFACTVRRHAQFLWNRVSAEWLSQILDESGNDPYGLRE